MTRPKAGLNLSQALSEFLKSPEGQLMLLDIDNSMKGVNPSAACLMCGAEIGTSRVLCHDCYRKNGGKYA